jgi:hypothetical protein
MLKEVKKHFRFDTLQKFVVDPDVWAFLAMPLTETAPNLDSGGQVLLNQKSFDAFRIDVVSAREAGASHADCYTGLGYIHAFGLCVYCIN